MCETKRDAAMEIRSKIWIEVNGEPVFSRGRGILLKAIDTYGSINKAAEETGISYRRAWGYIKAMEARLEVPLVKTRVGGRSGGGTRLTAEALEFLAKYENLERGMNEAVDKRFKKIFGDAAQV